MKKLLLSFGLILTGLATVYGQCTVSFNAGTGFPAATGYVAGQSFTTTCSGNISSISVPAASVGTNAAATLNVYAGNGTATTPIYTQAVGAITIANVGDPVTVNISGSLPVTNATQYTFAMDMDLDVYAGTGYAGGDAFQDGTNTAPLDVSFDVVISATTNVEEQVAATGVVIAPNPAQDVLKITTREKVLAVSIFNISGALVKNMNADNVINIEELESGMYFIRIETASGVTTNKFMKQ